MARTIQPPAALWPISVSGSRRVKWARWRRPSIGLRRKRLKREVSLPTKPHARRNSSRVEDGVTGEEVELDPVLLDGDVAEGDQQDDRPVEEAGRGIPDPHEEVRARAAWQEPMGRRAVGLRGMGSL